MRDLPWKVQKSWALPVASHLIDNGIYTLDQALQSSAFSALGPLHLLCPLPGMVFPRSFFLLLAHFIQVHLATDSSNNLRFQSIAFFHCLQPSLPKILKPCLLPPESTCVCVTPMNSLFFATNLVYLQCLVLQREFIFRALLI